MTRVARSNFDGIECKDFSKCLPGGQDRSGFTTWHNGCKAYIKLHFHKKIGSRISWNVLETLPMFFSGPFTVSDVCSTDWPKKDSANLVSQNFEGPYAKLNIEKKNDFFLFCINFTQIFRICPKRLQFLTYLLHN